MLAILSGFLTLDDYFDCITGVSPETAEAKNVDRRCLACSRLNALHIHGSYDRNPDRPLKIGKKLLNPLKIMRYICKYVECKKTCSFLPECIAHKRWYIWKVQQSIIQDRLYGMTWDSISRTRDVPIKTCRRWYYWLKNKFHDHAHVLKNVAGNLSQVLTDCIDFKSFWQKCFAHIGLDRAMLLCHQAGVGIP
jgi:hypothetical protein